MPKKQKTTKAVPASGQSMVLDPLDKRIAESVDSVRQIVSIVENRPALMPTSSDLGQSTQRKSSIPDVPRPVQRFLSGKIAIPAGECPVKPKGYKDKWPDGPASDEVVQNWAIDVHNHGEGRYAVEAVIYFARHFWDINGKEYKRIRELIVSALRISRSSDYEPVDIA